jgi:hypothetical protein
MTGQTRKKADHLLGRMKKAAELPEKGICQAMDRIIVSGIPSW